MRIPPSIFRYCKIDKISTIVSCCIFKIFTLLNLERAPTWAVPGLLNFKDVQTLSAEYFVSYLYHHLGDGEQETKSHWTNFAENPPLTWTYLNIITFLVSLRTVHSKEEKAMKKS